MSLTLPLAGGGNASGNLFQSYLDQLDRFSLAQPPLGWRIALYTSLACLAIILSSGIAIFWLMATKNAYGKRTQLWLFRMKAHQNPGEAPAYFISPNTIIWLAIQSITEGLAFMCVVLHDLLTSKLELNTADVAIYGMYSSCWMFPSIGIFLSTFGTMFTLALVPLDSDDPAGSRRTVRFNATFWNAICITVPFLIFIHGIISWTLVSHRIGLVYHNVPALKAGLDKLVSEQEAGQPLDFSGIGDLLTRGQYVEKQYNVFKTILDGTTGTWVVIYVGLAVFTSYVFTITLRRLTSRIHVVQAAIASRQLTADEDSPSPSTAATSPVQHVRTSIVQLPSSDSLQKEGVETEKEEVAAIPTEWSELRASPLNVQYPPPDLRQLRKPTVTLEMLLIRLKTSRTTVAMQFAFVTVNLAAMLITAVHGTLWSHGLAPPKELNSYHHLAIGFSMIGYSVPAMLNNLTILYRLWHHTYPRESSPNPGGNMPSYSAAGPPHQPSFRRPSAISQTSTIHKAISSLWRRPWNSSSTAHLPPATPLIIGVSVSYHITDDTRSYLPADEIDLQRTQALLYDDVQLQVPVSIPPPRRVRKRPRVKQEALNRDEDKKGAEVDEDMIVTPAPTVPTRYRTSAWIERGLEGYQLGSGP